ncbi:tRNA(Met) cytidine acetyltransferase TmcA domain-containing protein, partial [Halomonas salina]|uniref:tRNA(Met) cytidine acetyltransferase TmcA domain-containing protein n=1 Tax=Halomonas salina TaxID=42565 RepID=UPI00054E14AD
MEASVPAELLACQHRLGERRWRGLVWLAGEVEDVRARGLVLWHALGVKAPLWVGPEPPAGLEDAAWLPAAKARNRLGGEHDLIVFDALSPGAGFDPDAFGALSGTLRAGGLLVLLTPADWGARPDADYARLAAHPHAPDALSAHYLARLSCLLEASP